MDIAAVVKKQMSRFYQPVDIASLAFFRVAFGLLGFVDVLSTYVYYHWQRDAFSPHKIQFSYYGFEWVRPFPAPYMSAFFFLLMGAALLIAIGKWYRWVTPLFFVGYTYSFLLEKAFYLNHGYLFCWIAFVMIFLPANGAFSLDAKRDPELRRRYIPLWALFPLPFLMGLVYFYGGLAKLNGDWLRAVPLADWLGQKAATPFIGPLLAHEWTPWLMAYGGLLLDLSAPFLLLFRRTRPFIFAGIVFFHAVNHLIFNIGIFPFLSLALTALFFSPDWPRRLAARLFKQESTQEVPAPAFQRRRWMPAVLALFMAFHMLNPLRHWLFPGDVAWTEEGHRYAWRMMLRSKYGYGRFVIKDLDTGEATRYSPRQDLSDKQYRKIFTHPDMILQYAHYLRDREKRSGKRVAIYADINVSLNDRPYREFVDPKVDLAQEEWRFFRRSRWLRE
jgi:vitamin K-dependent gamma-carboxylase